jgi:hypothetical protein
MVDNKSEQSPVKPEVEEEVKAEARVNQKGLSKEAWAAVSAIAAALITGIFAIITTLIPSLLHPGQPSPTATSSNLESSPAPQLSPSPSLEPSPSLQPKPSPLSAPQVLLLALKAANIDYSVSEAQILSWLSSPGTEYPTITTGRLTLLPHQRLKNSIALDGIVYNYKQVSGLPVEKPLPPNHAVDGQKLKQAIFLAYNERHGPSAQSFAEIVEPF